MHRVIVVMCFIFSVLNAFSQEIEPDTIMQLEGVTITAPRLDKFTRGQVVQSLDSLTRRENPGGTLSELIPGFTSVYVRNYGQGILSTLSIRGTSANHSGLYWNGVRLSPPNIGYVDLLLIQADFFRDVSILYGGASPMFGSGAIGGGIHLDNPPRFDSAQLDGKFGISAGSFGNYLARGNLDLISKNMYSHTAFNVSAAENDFAYQDLAGNRENMDHSRFFKGGFLQDIAVRLPREQYLMASAWFQYGNREIPPALTESQSTAEQMDRSWRTMLSWKDFNRRNVLEAKAAWFNEFSRYVDPKTGIYSVIESQTAVIAFESTWDVFKNSALFAGANYTYEMADLDYYHAPENQHDVALYASWTQAFPVPGWQLSISARQEFLTGYKVPFLYALGAQGRIWKYLSGRLSFSRNFRAPTMNERYWKPGGNPDIQPEDSYNLEAGFSLKPEIWDSKQELSVTGFSSWVNNWILWLPGTGTWSVENAQEVWSRGIEIVLNERYTFGQAALLFTTSYTMTFSTNQKKLSEYDDSYRKQIIYTPVHRFLVKPAAEWKGFALSLRGNYTGPVYTTKDNDYNLPGYFLLDGIVSKRFNVRKSGQLTLQLNVNNMTNKGYEVVPYRPMPGVNVMGSVSFEF